MPPHHATASSPLLPMDVPRSVMTTDHEAAIRAATDALAAAILPRSVPRPTATTPDPSNCSRSTGRPHSRESAGRASTLRSGPAAYGRSRLAVVASFTARRV